MHIWDPDEFAIWKPDGNPDANHQYPDKNHRATLLLGISPKQANIMGKANKNMKKKHKIYQ